MDDLYLHAERVRAVLREVAITHVEAMDEVVASQRRWLDRATNDIDIARSEALLEQALKSRLLAVARVDELADRDDIANPI
jgi:hypothetical protein